MKKAVKLTPFQNALNAASNGDLKLPSVSYDGKNIGAFSYQLAVHKFNLSIMKSGMTCRGVKLKDLKTYYGLKGRSSSECCDYFIENIYNVCMAK